MTVNEITKDYIGWIPEDYIKELSREYYRGMICNDGRRNESAIIWRLINFEDKEIPTEVEILWVKITDRQTGDGLLEAFEEFVRETDVYRVYFEFSSLGEAETVLFKDHGFFIEKDESIDIRVTVGELLELKIAGKTPPPYVMSLSEIIPRQYKAAVMNSVFHRKYGLLDDLSQLPMDRFDQEVSSCVITDGVVDGLMLVRQAAAGEYIVELLFAMEPDARIKLLNMIRHSIQAAEEVCDKDESVILRRHNAATRNLITKLFPDKKGADVMKGEKYNV